MRGCSDGGAEGNRTPDLIIANDALYQLSYSPASETAALAVLCRACNGACEPAGIWGHLSGKRADVLAPCLPIGPIRRTSAPWRVCCLD